MKALILAAGRGTRMRGLCNAVPKPMLPLANVPVLEYLLRSLADAQMDHAVVVVGHLGEQVRATLPARAPRGMTLSFIEQKEPNGTGSAALLGRGDLGGEPFLLLFADIIVPRLTYAQMLGGFAADDCDAMLSVRRVPDPCFGAAVYVEDGRVRRILEKPPRGTSTTPFDNAGHFVMPPAVFDYLARLKPSPRGEYELTDAIAAMIADGLDFGVHEIDGFWFNLTSPEELLRANALLIDEVEATQLVSPRVRLTPPVAVAAGDDLGACRLGPNVSVGAGCVIDDDARIDNAILMPGARVGAGARVSNAILAEGVVVAPGEQLVGSPDEVAVRL